MGAHFHLPMRMLTWKENRRGCSQAWFARFPGRFEFRQTLYSSRLQAATGIDCGREAEGVRK
jgi:hypothetical protein